MNKDKKIELLSKLDDAGWRINSVAIGAASNDTAAIVSACGQFAEVLRELVQEVSEAKATAETNAATLGRML